MPKSNVIKKDTFHYLWSKSHQPVLNIKPGDRVHFEVNEVYTGQLSSRSKTEDLAKLDESKLYPLAGPVYIEGAEPGDALVVRVEDVRPAEWGWTAVVPGLGLLEEDFSSPELYIWKLPRSNRKFARFVKQIQVPLNPFCGVLGGRSSRERVLPSHATWETRWEYGHPASHGGG